MLRTRTDTAKLFVRLAYCNGIYSLFCHCTFGGGVICLHCVFCQSDLVSHRPNCLTTGIYTLQSATVHFVWPHLGRGTPWHRPCSPLSHLQFFNVAWRLNCSQASSQIDYISVCSIASWLSLQPWSRSDYNVVMMFRFNNNTTNNKMCPRSVFRCQRESILCVFSGLWTRQMTSRCTVDTVLPTYTDSGSSPATSSTGFCHGRQTLCPFHRSITVVLLSELPSTTASLTSVSSSHVCLQSCFSKFYIFSCRSAISDML